MTPGPLTRGRRGASLRLELSVANASVSASSEPRTRAPFCDLDSAALIGTLAMSAGLVFGCVPDAYLSEPDDSPVNLESATAPPSAMPMSSSPGLNPVPGEGMPVSVAPVSPMATGSVPPASMPVDPVQTPPSVPPEAEEVGLDRTWALWPMPNSPGLGLPNPRAYDTSSADIVRDEVTGLVWQRQAAPGFFAQAGAVSYCEALELAGFDDWQLPTYIELLSLVDFTSFNPAIDATAFPDTPYGLLEGFWSSSILQSGPPQGRTIRFDAGPFWTSLVDDPNHVRCVRAPVPEPASAGPRYEAIDAASVYDRFTQLTWQKMVAPDFHTWQGADDYCNALNAGSPPWRLPSVQELATIVDERLASPAVYGAVFPDTPASVFPTSSRCVACEPGLFWGVSFDIGSHGVFVQADETLETPPTLVRVRCVH